MPTRGDRGSRLARGRDRLRDRLTRRGLAPSVVMPALTATLKPAPTYLRHGTARLLFPDVVGQNACANVCPSVSILAEGVVRTMKLSSLRIFARPRWWWAPARDC